MTTDLFKNYYRIKSTRYAGWDYGWDGHYFVTICTKNREPYFGRIVNGAMVLNNFGAIVANEWEKTGDRKNIQLDEYIIMPNHFHAIIYINNQPIFMTLRESSVETLRATSLQNNQFSKISPKLGTLSIVVRSFKSAVSYNINKKYPNILFEWQPRFYDRIIRDDTELNTIRGYIQNNPINWENDEENNNDHTFVETLRATSLQG